MIGSEGNGFAGSSASYLAGSAPTEACTGYLSNQEGTWLKHIHHIRIDIIDFDALIRILGIHLTGCDLQVIICHHTGI